MLFVIGTRNTENETDHHNARERKSSTSSREQRFEYVFRMLVSASFVLRVLSARLKIINQAIGVNVVSISADIWRPTVCVLGTLNYRSRLRFWFTFDVDY